MKTSIYSLCLSLILAVVVNAAVGDKSLEAGFADPPSSAGIRCFWWWLNGNVTKEAISRDLKEMKAKGFSGALIFDAGGADQRGNAQVSAGPTFASQPWRELFRHAVQEADRRGLELSLNILSGWNVGGPTVTPDMAAKVLTWSEIQIEGGAPSAQKLPDPAQRGGFYRDIAVLAFPLRQPQDSTAVDSSGAEQKAQTVQSNLTAQRRSAPVPIQRRPIRDLQLKTASREVGMSAPDCRFLLEDIPAVAGEEDAGAKDILNITDKMTPEGILTWEVPPGKWDILRFGYTLSDAQVSTYSADWKGLVIDYMDAGALQTYWNQVVQPLMQDIGPLTGKCLMYLHTDSWECGGANWTGQFAAEFKKRRGYDPILYLPIIAGKIVESRDVSNRFLADFRKTIGDCVAENHYQVFARLAHQSNLCIHPESGGPHAGPFDALQCLGRSDIPMSEFWVPSPHRPTPAQRFFVKQASSAAHIYGKKLVGAEAFTSIGPHWDDVLWAAQKPSFDHEVCSGLTLAFVHTFTCSPRQMGLPGQEYFAGTHFNPNVTWWEYAGAFVGYLNRCQFLCGQGKFVADVLYYYGDHVPNVMQLKEADPAKVMPGFDYDVSNEEVLLKLRLQDGRITTPAGAGYRLLVLPDHKILSLAALKKVRELVQDGATVTGPKPAKAVSLVGYPESEKEFWSLADELWGRAPDPVGQRPFGKGRIVWDKTAREVLLNDGLKPDFEIRNMPEDAVFDYIHYAMDESDIYFVCNQKQRAEDVTCVFRVSGKQPELWDPVTGNIREAKAFRQSNGQTEIPLGFAVYGSVFVVFRRPISKDVQGRAGANDPHYRALQRIEEPWDVYFDPNGRGPGRVRFEQLVSWTQRPEEGIRSYSGKAIYTTTFRLSGPKTVGRQHVLDLGEVLDTGIARVRLNGRDLGVVWSKPFRVDVTNAMQDGDNALTVEVVNSWRNRLVADRDLPADQRCTQTNIRVLPNWKPNDSGLLGPVQILASQE